MKKSVKLLELPSPKKANKGNQNFSEKITNIESMQLSKKYNSQANLKDEKKNLERKI